MKYFFKLHLHLPSYNTTLHVVASLRNEKIIRQRFYLIIPRKDIALVSEDLHHPTLKVKVSLRLQIKEVCFRLSSRLAYNF